MLDQWLNPTSVSLFSRDYLRKQPYARPFAARNAMAIFTWATLDRLLTERPAADILVVARGKLVEVATPRCLADARSLMVEGIGLVIRRAEQHDAGLAKLAASFAERIPGEVHVQLFVTPAGAYGFGWHYDDEDVFIAQTDGAKDYFFRGNSVEHLRRPEATPDFSRVREETSSIGSARLIAGDWLYIPSRWWHVAKCVEDSLSISLGVRPDPSWLETIR
jgi:ribosomal protein L16 Arg81 hydroxylase